MIYFLAIFLCFLTLNVAGQKELVCVVSGSGCTFTGQKVHHYEIVQIKVEPEGSSFNGITEVYFKSSSMFYIPPELFDVFVNLKRLEMESQNIKEVKPHTFKNATNLEVLWMTQNKISHLHANMFDGAENLKVLACGQMLVEKFHVNKDALNGEF